MSDNDDDLINAAFDEFTSASTPAVRPAGANAARMTAKHRRRVRATVLSGLAALFIITPVTAYAVTAHGGQSPPHQPAATGAPSPSLSPSPTPSPSASATPSTTPPSSPPPVQAAPPPDGRISYNQLIAGKVTIPKWGFEPGVCVDGRQLLGSSTGRINDNAHLNDSELYKVVHVNLDDDSSLETAALITCQFGEAAIGQIVGFDRDSSGHIVTLGQLVKGYLWSLTTNSDGGITVDISDLEACCETPKVQEEHQQRQYGWDGSALTQTGGPTAFLSHSKPDTFRVMVTSAKYSAPSNDVVSSTITVTVTNTGAYPSQQLLVSGGFPGQLGPDMKLVPGLRPGKSETVTLAIDWRLPLVAGDQTIDVYEMGSVSIGESSTRLQIDVPTPSDAPTP